MFCHGPPGAPAAGRAVSRFSENRCPSRPAAAKRRRTPPPVTSLPRNFRRRRRHPRTPLHTNDHRLEPVPIAADNPLSRLRGRPGGGPLPRQRKRQAKPGKGAHHAERPSPNPSRRAGGGHDVTPPNMSPALSTAAPRPASPRKWERRRFSGGSPPRKRMQPAGGGPAGCVAGSRGGNRYRQGIPRKLACAGSGPAVSAKTATARMATANPAAAMARRPLFRFSASRLCAFPGFAACFRTSTFPSLRRYAVVFDPVRPEPANSEPDKCNLAMAPDKGQYRFLFASIIFSHDTAHLQCPSCSPAVPVEPSPGLGASALVFARIACVRARPRRRGFARLIARARASARRTSPVCSIRVVSHRRQAKRRPDTACS